MIIKLTRELPGAKEQDLRSIIENESILGPRETKRVYNKI